MGNKTILTISKAAKFLGVSISSLRRWDESGRLSPVKSGGTHRRYVYDDLVKFMSDKDINIKEEKIPELVIVYARVSSSDQKGDLERQVEKLSKYCVDKGYPYQVIQDLGSGLNYKKKGLKQLINLICNKKINKIIITYKDRLIRFGYEIIEELCKIHQVDIEVLEDDVTKTYEQELVEDVLSIITVFSSKLYGSRSKKKKDLINTVTNYLIEDKAVNE